MKKLTIPHQSEAEIQAPASTWHCTFYLEKVKVHGSEFFCFI